MITNKLTAQRIPTPLLERVIQHAKDNDLNQSQVVRRAISHYLNQFDDEQEYLTHQKPTKAKSGWLIDGGL